MASIGISASSQEFSEFFFEGFLGYNRFIKFAADLVSFLSFALLSILAGNVGLTNVYNN